MEGKIKKSIFVFMFIAIASFILTATVSAGGKPIKHGLHGTYAEVGGGFGLMAFCGFDAMQYPNYVSDTFGPYWIISVVVEGTLTLNPDGTGTKNDTGFVQTQPNTLLGPTNDLNRIMIQPWVGEQTLNTNITYEVTEDGTIIISTVGVTWGVWKSGPLAGSSMPNAAASWRCRMTPDHKALTCVRIPTAGDAGEGLCGTGVVAKIINNDFFVAIWQH
jgi:hypothetical protein